MTVCRRGLVPLALLLAVFGAAGGWLLNLHRVDQQQQYYRKHTEMLQMSYQAALESCRRVTDIYLQDTIRQPELLQLFSRAWHADEQEKARLRHELYRRLNRSNQLLWQQCLRQLHFHLPNGESFLRFYQPNRFGDHLFNVRPSVQLANTERRAVVSFEAGRVGTGFRFVSPLTYRGVHIGSVETSLPFRALQDLMVRLSPGEEYQFLISADLIRERLFAEYRDNYVPSRFPALLVENPRRHGPDSALPLSEVARKLEERLAGDRAILDQLQRGLPFSVGLIQRKIGYVVSFLPVREVTGRLGGYIVAYKPEPLIVAQWRSSLLELTVFVLLLALTGWLLLRWRGSALQLTEQEARRQYQEALQVQQERLEHEERTRISRELHDRIGQALLGVNLRLKLLWEEMPQEKTEDRRALGQLIEDIQQATAELRNLVLSLRPLPLAGMRVDEAVQWLCRNLERHAGVSVLLQVTGNFEEVSDSCSLVLFRVCQEGLTNILKHAAATRVQLTLHSCRGLLSMTLQDNGAGGAAVPENDSSSGLALMRARVEQLGGRFLLDSPAGEGTRLFVELPCYR